MHAHRVFYMNTFIYIYIQTYLNTYLGTYIHSYIGLHAYIFMTTCMHAYIHGYIMHTYIHSYIHMMHQHNIIVVSTFSAGLLPQFAYKDELGSETDAGQLSLVLHALDALTGVVLIFNHRRHVRPVICSAK